MSVKELIEQRIDYLNRWVKDDKKTSNPTIKVMIFQMKSELEFLKTLKENYDASNKDKQGRV